MSMYIADKTNEFIKRLNIVQQQMEGFSLELEQHSSQIEEALHRFESQCQQILESLPVRKTGEHNEVDAVLLQTASTRQKLIQQWHRRIQERQKGTTFMHKHEKYLVVMVFGAVKTGKSTLGNFFAGKELRKAPFDNAYKQLPMPVFKTEEKGRETGDIEKDASGQYWFSEGVTDTTGDIQFFTLSGMRWMDSPGTGALSKDGDSRNMEEMVNEYISYTDLCIFLMNSSEPGLQSDMKYMEKLSREGQESLVVITKSDVNDEDCDDDGNLIKRLKAKSPENRKLQEDDICRRVAEQYPTLDANRFRAVSVSTQLAKEAIAENDEQKYKDSHLDLLMDILGSKVSREAIALKEKKPRQTLNTFIDSFLGETGASAQAGTEQEPSLHFLEAQLAQTLCNIQQYQKEIQARTTRITRAVSREVRRNVMAEARRWDQNVSSNSSFDMQTVKKYVAQEIVRTMRKHMAAELSEIIQDYQQKELQQVQVALDTPVLKKQSEVITQTYVEKKMVQRDADGLWENIRSFFGKNYYEEKEITHTLQKTIDLGTNLDEFLDSLLPQVESIVHDKVRKELENLQKTYFAPQEQTVHQVQQCIDTLRTTLTALKFDK